MINKCAHERSERGTVIRLECSLTLMTIFTDLTKENNQKESRV